MNPPAADDRFWTECGAPMPAMGDEVKAACGWTIHYAVTTPCVTYMNETVHFCLPICLADFENDPLRSCLAWRFNHP